MPPVSSGDHTTGQLPMILGLVSIPLVFCYALGRPAGIAAVVLGGRDLRRAGRGRGGGRGGGRGPAVTGLVCGAVAVALAVLLIARPDG